MDPKRWEGYGGEAGLGREWQGGWTQSGVWGVEWVQMRSGRDGKGESGAACRALFLLPPPPPILVGQFAS